MMNKRHLYIQLVNNEKLRIEINPSKSDSKPFFFIFGLHKSGSTLLNNIFNDICTEANIEQISLEELLFEKGFTPIDINIEGFPFYNGICYRGFRSFWINNIMPKNDSRSIVLVRDPRDALISYFFSDKYSHPIPEMGSITQSMRLTRNKLSTVENPEDDYNWLLNRAKFLRKNILDYACVLQNENFRFYRYEDVIFYKEEWIRNMVDFLGIDITNSKIEKIAKKNDVIPEQENKKEHIRSVIPGNYKKYFSEKK